MNNTEHKYYMGIEVDIEIAGAFFKLLGKITDAMAIGNLYYYRRAVCENLSSK